MSRIFRQGFPWLLVGDDTNPVIRLRRHAIQARIGMRGTWLWLISSIAMAAGWPIGSAYEALRTLGRRDEFTNAGFVARARWFAFAWRTALLHNIPPTSTASFRLAEDGRRHMGPKFLLWTDSAGLALLNAANEAAIAHVQDKALFARLCEDHDLPCVETLAAFRDGLQIYPAVPFIPRESAIHVKKLAGSQGQGASRWVRHGDIYRNDSGLERSPEGLMALCQQGGFIVQPLLTNHSALAPLSLGCLADVRIVTAIRPDGVAVVVGRATMRLPTRASATDRSPLWTLVDSQTGRILSARQRGRPVTHHPDSDLALNGHQLPHWPDAVALVTRAHRTAFPRFVSLGWDVALTPDGPVLIEANAGWGAEIMQTLNGEPLGDTVLAEILSHYV